MKVTKRVLGALRLADDLASDEWTDDPDAVHPDQLGSTRCCGTMEAELQVGPLKCSASIINALEPDVSLPTPCLFSLVIAARSEIGAICSTRRRHPYHRSKLLLIAGKMPGLAH